MKTRYSKNIAPFSLAALVAAGMLISAPVFAAGMSDTDTNADGQIDQSELEQSLTVSMQSLDSDGDGQISQSEFESATGGAIVFSDFDSNGDGMIDQQEMSQGAFARYDTDGNQSFSEDEFALYEQEFGAGSGMSGDSASSEDMSTTTGSDTSATTDLESDSDLTASSDLESESTETDTMASDADVSASSELDATGETTDTTTSDAMGGGLAGYAAEDVMGADIIGANGDSIGDVSDLVLDSSNQVSDVIVDVGGFLGIGSQSVALPASDLQISQGEDGNIQAITSLTESELEQMGEYQDIEGDDYRLYSAEPAETGTETGTDTSTMQ